MPTAMRGAKALVRFEILPMLKSPLPWVALACMILLVIPIRLLFEGNLSINGQQLGQDFRIRYVVVIGYSGIVFLSTLFTLCLCLERTGAHYLKNNDLLVLSRSVGRGGFYLSKIASILIPALAYAGFGLLLFWEEMYRQAGVNLWQVFFLILPLGLSLGCLVSLYFFMRNFLTNFMIFFLWLILLPFIYIPNLWTHYAGVFREATSEFHGLRMLGIFLDALPQFGGVHAHSLGMVHDFFKRGETWQALMNVAVWMVIALAAGLAVFARKRL